MNISEFTKPSGKIIKTLERANAFVPGTLPPNIVFSPSLIARLVEAERNLGELIGAAEMVPNPQLLIHPFIRREAVLSSRIEGTQASLSDVFAFEATGEIKSSNSDVFEVMNYAHALDYGLDRLKDLPISLRLFKELHERLLKGTRGSDRKPGEFRQVQNWIGPQGTSIENSRYVPPPVTDMHESLNALEKFIHAKTEIPDLIRLALIHYQFEAIHPFEDGNGRIGRLILTLLLCEWKIIPRPLLHLSAFFEKNRRDYYDLLLKVSQTSDWDLWISFFLEGVAHESKDSAKKFKALLGLREKYRDKLQATRSSALILKLLDHLFISPIVTPTGVQSLLKSTNRTAHQNIQKLKTNGILKEMPGRLRNKFFMAAEILKTVEAP